MKKTFSHFVLVAFAMILCQAGTLPAGAQDNASQIIQSRGKQTYNVFSYGAMGNGKGLDSPAINRAIDACAQNGGGTVYLPAGVFLRGVIHLKSKNHLVFYAEMWVLGGPH